MGVASRAKNLLSPEGLPLVYWELLFIGAAVMTGMSLPSSFLPIMASDLDPSGFLVGLVTSAWFFSRIFLEFPAGIISDRVGHRRLMIFGIALSCLGPLLCSFASSIWMLIIGRGVWGLGTAFYFMNNMAMLMEILPRNVRGRALGLFQGLEFIGSFMGAPVGAFLAVYFTYNQVFYFTLAMTVISLVIAWFSGNLRGIEHRDSKRELPSINEIKSAVMNHAILAICFSSMFRMLVMQGVFQTILQLYLKKTLLFDIESIGLIVSMKVLGQVPALVAAGMLSDKFGRKPILLAGFGVSAASLFLLTKVDSFGGLMLVNFLGGVGEGLDMTTLIAWLTDITPSNFKGGTMGLFRTFMDVGGFIGPILFMLMFSSFSPNIAFYLGMALNLVNLLLISTIRSKPKDQV